MTPEELAAMIAKARADGDFDTDWEGQPGEADERIQRAIDGQLPDDE